MKQLSVGTIITDNKNILIGHTTWGKGFDIPKGRQEEGETYIQTAMRELNEEFGIVETEFRFQELGMFEYLKNKDLFLFKIKYGNLHQDITLSTLKCSSYFDKDGKQFPEINGYKIITIESIKNYCYLSLTKVLNQIFVQQENYERYNRYRSRR
jgi:predicted NUDIX family NTP pyrophosphohydrolase